MSFLEGFAQGFTQERTRRLEKEQRAEELKLQYAMPELMKRKADWETRKEKDKVISQQATTLAQQVGDPSFVPAAMQELNNGVSYESMQERIAKGHYTKTKKDSTVVVPTDPTAPVSTPAPVANPMRADSTPMTTDGPVVDPVVSAPNGNKTKVPQAVAAPKGVPDQYGSTLEGPVQAGDDTSGIRHVDSKLRDRIAEIDPQAADLYTASPDTVLRTEDKPIADSGWTLKADAVQGKLTVGIDKITDRNGASEALKAADEGRLNLTDLDRQYLSNVSIGGLERSANQRANRVPSSPEAAQAIKADPEANASEIAMADAYIKAKESGPKITDTSTANEASVYKNSPELWAQLPKEQQLMADAILKRDQEVYDRSRNPTKEVFPTNVQAIEMSKSSDPAIAAKGKSIVDSYDQLEAAKDKRTGETDFNKLINPGMNINVAKRIQDLIDKGDAQVDNLTNAQMRQVKSALEIDQADQAKKQKTSEQTAALSSGDKYFIKEGNTWKIVPAGTDGAKRWTKEDQQAFDKASAETSDASKEIATKESSYSSTLSYLKMAKSLDKDALTTASKTVLPFINWVSKNAGSLDTMIQNIHANGSDIDLGLTTVNGKYSQEEFATLASKIKSAADYALSDANRGLLEDTQRAAMIKLGLTFDTLMMNNQSGNGVSQKEFSETYTKLGDDYMSMKNTVEAPLKAVRTRIDSLKQSIKTNPKMKMVAANSELGEVPNFDSASASGISPDTEAFYNSEYSSNQTQSDPVNDPSIIDKLNSGDQGSLAIAKKLKEDAIKAGKTSFTIGGQIFQIK